MRPDEMSGRTCWKIKIQFKIFFSGTSSPTRQCMWESMQWTPPATARATTTTTAPSSSTSSVSLSSARSDFHTSHQNPIMRRRHKHCHQAELDEIKQSTCLSVNVCLEVNQNQKSMLMPSGCELCFHSSSNKSLRFHSLFNYERKQKQILFAFSPKIKKFY